MVYQVNFINKSDFLEMVREVQKQNILSDSRRKGAIRLIFEKEDRSDLKFYRPILLLNVGCENYQNFSSETG